MGDLDKALRILDETLAQEKAERYQRNLKLIQESGIPYELVQGTSQVLLHVYGEGVIECWPSTNRWYSKRRGQVVTGIDDLLKSIALDKRRRLA